MAGASVSLDRTPQSALALVAEQAELWGADWQATGDTSGKLGMPVSAGLRRGWIEGTVVCEADGNHSSRILFEQENAEYRVDRGSVMILVAAAFGCLITLVAVFFPRIFPLVPIGILLAFGGYLVVIARLRNSGPEEFLQAIVDDADG